MSLAGAAARIVLGLALIFLGLAVIELRFLPSWVLLHGWLMVACLCGGTAALLSGAYAVHMTTRRRGWPCGFLGWVVAGPAAAFAVLLGLLGCLSLACEAGSTASKVHDAGRVSIYEVDTGGFCLHDCKTYFYARIDPLPVLRHIGVAGRTGFPGHARIDELGDWIRVDSGWGCARVHRSTARREDC